MTDIRRRIEDWWPALPEALRSELRTKLDREPMSANAVVAVTHARGVGPAAVTLVDGEAVDSPQFFLGAEDYAWIADRRELDATRAALDSAIPDDPGAVDRAIPRDDEALRNLFPGPPEDIRTMRF
ncbi:hypothetical protein C5C71_06435 [Rathayibacter sp. AY1C1]|uniref:hypothetical protein n=1 Tax=Rathayibacter sp. AY1C1 TaxID=2080534 RepID=UPI000CE72C74|nr:hypothetical protein [Rathayibacter sp. AY1C1]PPH11637.1 hypothetical protein C5C71_06435 [Rathayibacter sp. AY1C1]